MTIAICSVAILCLVYFLMYTFFLIPLALLIIVQILLLLGVLVLEISKSRSLGRHAVVLVLVLATIGAGFYLTASVASNYVPKPRGKMMMPK
jgi:hypothetical protein